MVEKPKPVRKADKKPEEGKADQMSKEALKKHKEKVRNEPCQFGSNCRREAAKPGSWWRMH